MSDTRKETIEIAKDRIQQLIDEKGATKELTEELERYNEMQKEVNKTTVFANITKGLLEFQDKAKKIKSIATKESEIEKRKNLYMGTYGRFLPPKEIEKYFSMLELELDKFKSRADVQMKELVDSFWGMYKKTIADKTITEDEIRGLESIIAPYEKKLGMLNEEYLAKSNLLDKSKESYKQDKLDVDAIQAKIKKYNEIIPSVQLYTEQLRLLGIEMEKIPPEKVPLSAEELKKQQKLLEKITDLTRKYSADYDELIGHVRSLNSVQAEHANIIRDIENEMKREGIKTNEEIKKSIASLKELLALIYKIKEAERMEEIGKMLGVGRTVGRARTAGYGENRIQVEVDRINAILELDKWERIEREKIKALEFVSDADRETALIGIVFEANQKKLDIERDYQNNIYALRTEAYDELNAQQKAAADLMANSVEQGLSVVSNAFAQNNIKQIKGLQLLGKFAEITARGMVANWLKAQGKQMIIEGAAAVAKGKIMAALMALNPLGTISNGYALMAIGAAMAGAGAAMAPSSYAAQQGMNFTGAGAGGAGGAGAEGVAGGGGGITGTVQARELKITIAPVVHVEAGHDIFIGSGSIEEFEDIIETTSVNAINQALQTGEIDLNLVIGAR